MPPASPFPAELYEAARIDGATRWQAFRRVTLPILAPAMLIALLFRYIFAFRLFSEAWLLTKGGPARSTEVVAIYLYQEAFSFSAFGSAAATAWIMVLASLLLAGAYVFLLKRGGVAMRTERLLVGLGKALAVAAILIWSLFPILFIAMSSLKPGQDIFAVPPKWLFTPTFKHYGELWRSWGVFFDGLLNSLLITVGATLLAIVASACAGYVYSRNSGRWLDASMGGLIIVRLIPPIVVTLPLFPIVNWLGLSDTHLVLILLYATFFVSLGTVLMRTFMDQIPRELDEAAAMGRREPPHDPAQGHRAAGDARRARRRRLRHRLLLERVPLRLHLHRDQGEDRAAGDLGDDRLHRRGRLGDPVRRRDGAARARPALRRLHEPLPRGRPHRRLHEGLANHKKGRTIMLIKPETKLTRRAFVAGTAGTAVALAVGPAFAAGKTLNVLSHKVHQTVLGSGEGDLMASWRKASDAEASFTTFDSNPLQDRLFREASLKETDYGVGYLIDNRPTSQIAALFEPLGPYQDKDPIEDFGDIASGLVQGMTVDGKLIGIPMRHATQGLFYNEALLEEAGNSAPPTTLEDLIDQARKTTFTARSGTPVTGMVLASDLAVFPVMFARAYGGDFIGPDLKLVPNREAMERGWPPFAACSRPAACRAATPRPRTTTRSPGCSRAARPSPCCPLPAARSSTMPSRASFPPDQGRRVPGLGRDQGQDADGRGRRGLGDVDPPERQGQGTGLELHQGGLEQARDARHGDQRQWARPRLDLWG